MLKKPYKIAAIAYLIYGLIYLSAAAHLMTPERMSDSRVLPWWGFFLLGALETVIFPALVWREWKWFTRILAFGPLGKAIQLLYREFSWESEPRALMLLFAAIALTASALLFRAGFSLKPGIRNSETEI